MCCASHKRNALTYLRALPRLLERERDRDRPALLRALPLPPLAPPLRERERALDGFFFPAPVTEVVMMKAEEGYITVLIFNKKINN